MLSQTQHSISRRAVFLVFVEQEDISAHAYTFQSQHEFPSRHEYDSHFTKKWTLPRAGLDVTNSEGCFGCHKNAFSRQKRIFLKTKKADQKHCDIWRRESGSEFHKTSPTCDRSEWQKQLRDSFTQSLKQTPLGSGTVLSLCRYTG